MKFVGRTRELARMRRELEHQAQRNVLVYGRRRVGKSELIKQALTVSKVAVPLYYECRETSERDNIESLAALISDIYGLPPLAFRSFSELLEFLFSQSDASATVLVLDEYPYLRNVIKGIDSIIQAAIDAHRESSQLKIVLCGSYVEVMKSLLEASNPLYGRIDFALELTAMDYYDSALFYPDFSAADKFRLYSVFGGIPYYNRLIDQDVSVRSNIIELVTAPSARLEYEVPQYLGSEISKIANANEVFGALAQGHSRWRDILSQSHVSSGPAMADVLSKLAVMGLVEKRAPINDPHNKRKAEYRISDPLTLFYYRFVFRYLSQRQLLDPEVFYDRFVDAAFGEQHVPYVFEGVCRQYLVRENRAGRVEPPFDAIGKYWYDDPANHTSGEFDVVTHDPEGYVFYEAKFRGTPITQRMIDDEIAQVEAAGLACHAYGFFSRSGFEASAGENMQFIELDQMYE